MLFSLGHGQHIIEEPAVRTRTLRTSRTAAAPATDAVPIDAVVETEAAPQRRSISPGTAPLAPMLTGGTFAYFFPDGDANAEDPAMPAKLDAVATAMIEQNGGLPAQNASVPPIFTYLGQFIDHDITANTDRESDLSQIDGAIAPVARADVEAGLFNIRDGSLRLDSLYGDTVGQGPFATKLAGLMRHPTFTTKMRLGTPTAVPDQKTPLPADPAADLLRLGFLMDRGLITQAELDALPPELRGNFVNGDGTPKVARAIIGDGRNDENLLVAQLHMSFLRFHNKLADAAGSFENARKLTRWHYQWLTVNEYLRTVCDPAVVDDVIAREAPLYSDFFAAHGTAGSTQMPMPLEFSVAAFRFGHSMIRGIYDHNRFFGEAVNGFPNVQPQAEFNLLFGFTGNGDMLGTGPQLPSNWVIEWDRFVALDPTRPRRTARTIDTFLAPPLEDLVNEPAGVFKHLAKRNLRRGYRLSIPTGQACIAKLKAGHYPDLEVMPHHQLAAGSAGDALDEAGLADATPLWFYILKEAEKLGEGQHLGPLGSILVAETLVGLVVKDPDSYWHGGAGGGRWTPADANLPGGPVDTVAKMLRFAGMLQ